MRVNSRYVISVGFVLYATVFMLWSLLTTYGLMYGTGAQLASYAVTAAATFAATRFVGAKSVSAWMYGVGWALTYILLDILYIAPVAGFDSLLTAFNFISYGIVLVTPIIVAAITGFRESRNATAVNS